MPSSGARLGGVTELHVVCALGRAKRGALAEVVSRESSFNLEAVNQRDENGHTPLHFASAHGHTRLLSALIDLKADPNAKDKYGGTALHIAACQGHAQSVSALLQKGGVDIADDDGDTALNVALEAGHDDIAAVLRSARCTPDASVPAAQLAAARDAFSPFESRRGSAKVSYVRLPRAVGWSTRLHTAAEDGNVDQVREILHERPGWINQPDPGGWVPLHYAAKEGQAELCAILIQHGGYVDAQDHDGWQPLSQAAYHNHVGAAAVLLRHGAMLGATNREGDTALAIAEEFDLEDVVSYLSQVQECADTRAARLPGSRPLALYWNPTTHHVCVGWQRDCVKTILLLFERNTRLYELQRSHGEHVSKVRAQHEGGGELLAGTDTTKRHTVSTAPTLWLPVEMWLKCLSFLRPFDFGVSPNAHVTSV